MAIELMDLCKINRKAGPQFIPEFFDSAYGPALLLHFETVDLFLLTEQLETVAEVLPTLFTFWIQALMGLNAETFVDTLERFGELHQEAMDLEQEDVSDSG